MATLFDYNTFTLKFNRKRQNITLQLNENQTHLDFEVLFELESFLGWAVGHLEIRSILLTSLNDSFSLGLDTKSLSKMSDQSLEKSLDKLRSIAIGFLNAPQIIIFDLNKHIACEAVELSLAADIRFMDEAGTFSLNHLKKGLLPNCGGIGLLSEMVGNARSKSWLFTGRDVDSAEGLACGYVSQTYHSSQREDFIDKQLEKLTTFSHIMAIQGKRAHLETIRASLEASFTYEPQMAKAGLMSLDWKTFANTQESYSPNFLTPSDFAKLLRSQLDVEEARE